MDMRETRPRTSGRPMIGNLKAAGSGAAGSPPRGVGGVIAPADQDC